ncbi:MAG: hypothetical protein ACIAQF_08745 [Phycisphaerales bacterium JB065]
MSRVDRVLSARHRAVIGLRLIGAVFVALGLMLLLGWVAAAGVESLLSQQNRVAGYPYSRSGGFAGWLSLLRVLGYAGFCCCTGGFFVIFIAPRVGSIWMPFGRSGDCPRCLYPLAGLEESACPECGLSLEGIHPQLGASPSLRDEADRGLIRWIWIARWVGLALVTLGVLLGLSALWGIFVAPGSRGGRGSQPSSLGGYLLLAIILFWGGVAMAIWARVSLRKGAR